MEIKVKKVKELKTDLEAKRALFEKYKVLTTAILDDFLNIF